MTTGNEDSTSSAHCRELLKSMPVPAAQHGSSWGGFAYGKRLSPHSVAMVCYVDNSSRISMCNASASA